MKSSSGSEEEGEEEEVEALEEERKREQAVSLKEKVLKFSHFCRACGDHIPWGVPMAASSLP